MVIDIKRTVIRTHLRRLITLICLTLIILVIILIGNLQKSFLGMNKYQWSVIIGVLYLLSLIFEPLLEMIYIYFSDDGDYIVFRYFSMSIFSKKKNSIEIPKKVFGGYQLINSLQGFKQKIVLLQRVKDKKAKYPPVSLVSLNKKQLKSILITLDKYK
ncbi:hypothetical protein ES705_19130 [subsurface metagenome]